MTGDVKTLSKLTSGTQFVYDKNKGLALKPKNEKDEPTRYFSSVADMYDLFGYGSAEGRQKWMGWISDIWSQRNPTKPTVLTATKAEWINRGWSEAQIKEGIKTGKIIVK